MARQAVDCWAFCEGWAPERWPVYAALHRVDDWSALVELMQAIRTRHRELDQEEKAHHDRTTAALPGQR